MSIQKGILSSWKLIIFLLLLSLIFNLYLFPKYQIKYNNENLISLDLRSSYSYHEVSELFSKMGEAGRKNYQISAGIIDMIYPAIYGPLLILLILKLFNHLFKSKSNLKYLIILPVIIMILDYSENINTLKMLAEYPLLNEASVLRGSIFSGIKWYLVSFVLVLLIAGTLYSLLKFMISKWIERTNTK